MRKILKDFETPSTSQGPPPMPAASNEPVPSTSKGPTATSNEPVQSTSKGPMQGNKFITLISDTFANKLNTILYNAIGLLTYLPFRVQFNYFIILLLTQLFKRPQKLPFHLQFNYCPYIKRKFVSYTASVPYHLRFNYCPYIKRKFVS